MTRTQHVASSGVVLAVGLWVLWISFTQQPASAFLFPRLISVAFVGLAAWTFGKALLGWSKVGDGVSAELAKRLAPGLILACVYIFWAAKTLGFYAATTVAVFLLITWYDGRAMTDLKAWIRRVVITAIIMAVLYGLFAKVLAVYTPRGMLM